MRFLGKEGVNVVDIRNIDCLEGLKSIEDNSVDCVVTSPPYNKGTQQHHVGNQIWKGFKIDYDEYQDNKSEQEYESWMVKVLDELYRIIKPDGSVFFNHKVILRDCLGHFPKWVWNSRLSLYQMIIWNRKCSSNMRSETLYPTYELVFWLVKGKPKVFKAQAKHKNDIWEILPDRNNRHPAPFPYELAENCINLACKKETHCVIVDPFAGSGTSALVAQNYGYDFIGFEISPEYIKMTNDRLAGVARTKQGYIQESLF